MSGGDERPARKHWRDSCMDKIYATTWKKVEGDYLVTTTVSPTGSHKIVKERIKK